MGLLQAGASVKGEFEKRLKSVIDEVKASPKPLIMFIDEAIRSILVKGDFDQLTGMLQASAGRSCASAPRRAGAAWTR